MTVPDQVLVVAIAGAASLATAVAGALALHALRRQRLVLSVVVVALVSVAAVLVGAVATAQAMFLSGHDLRVLLVVAAVAGTVGVAAAVLLGRRVAAGSQALALAAPGIGGTYTRPDVVLSAELAALDLSLADTSRELAATRTRDHAREAGRRELVAWVSHDLRTPLAGIRAMAEALEDRVVTDSVTVARYHAGIRAETDRLAGLVDDLFELSRINAGALDLALAAVSLADVVSDAVASAQPLAAAKGVRLAAGAQGSPVVQGSVPELGRVLRNLLTNAIRHTPSDGLVAVSTGVDGDAVWVDVHDGCGGVPEGDLPRVFEVAFRGGSARTPGDGGGGLGLAIARGLVEAHHGEISMVNHGPGCRVSVRLPAAREPG